MQKIPKFYKWRHIPSGLFWIGQRYHEVDQDPAFQPAMNHPHVLTNLDQYGKIFSIKRKIEGLGIGRYGYVDAQGNLVPSGQRHALGAVYQKLPPTFYSHLSGWYWVWDNQAVAPVGSSRNYTPGYVIKQEDIPLIRSEWELIEYELREIGPV